MHHIDSIDRDQITMFPEALDDYISPDNPVRFIDAFIRSLDLLTRISARHSCRHRKSSAHTGDLLRLYIYGYLNHVLSSRRLEKETNRNVVYLMWLLRRLTPDFKTIADFRRDKHKAIQKVCRSFTLFCRECDLFGGELIAIRRCLSATG